MREQAAASFAAKRGVDAESLEERDGFLGFVRPGSSLADVLPDRLEAIVSGLSFGKTMVWNGDGKRFPRPVRWLCARLDKAKVGELGTTSFGHRFTHAAVDVPRADAYLDTLRAANVEADQHERRRRIVAGLPEGWSDPLGKLDEVVHLVEWPVVLDGRYDERYLELPRRVVETAMQSHQRYFPLEGGRFAFVANGGDPETVRAGNERVLETRLGDAAFTYERDLAVGIDGLAKRLETITFFAGAGTYADKAERLSRLVEELGGGSHELIAARLAKADQASELVREFPDLEGYIGAHYARLAGQHDEVCTAIEEHYLPDAGGGPLPSTLTGRILAAADKLDTLLVSFELGHRPTGSRDPFGLRRAAIGLCRLAVEGDVRVPGALLTPDVREFVEERLEALLGIPVEFVRAARGADVDALGDVAAVARALADLPRERLTRLHTVFTRAARIVAKAGEDLPPLQIELLTEPAERDVAGATREAARRVADEPELDDRIAALEELAPALETFFEEVLVMAEDDRVRQNRLRLLLDVRDLIRATAGDLSQLAI
jgi:glycyl-tRNA synthetase beta chain